MTNIIDKVAELNAELSNFIEELTEDNLISNKREISNTLAYLTPTVVKDSILATGLTKVYHHGFDN
jgi:hypothetical protein